MPAEQDPFLNHLITVLAVYELGKSPNEIPRYDGPSDWQTQSVLRSIESIGKRLSTAEKENAVLKAGEPKQCRAAPSSTTAHNGAATNSAAQTTGASQPDLIKDVTQVCLGLARGELSQRVTASARDPDLNQLKTAVNSLADVTSNFTREISRTSIQLGVESKLQARPIASDKYEGEWQETANNVNKGAESLTVQVRSLTVVATAFGMGDLSQKLAFEAQGEMKELKEAVNHVVGHSEIFVNEFLRATADINVRGNLGGQMHTPNAMGVWRDLAVNANQTFTCLTDQVRAVNQVVAAIRSGDFDTNIGIEVKGEMLALKEAVDQLLSELKTRKS